MITWTAPANAALEDYLAAIAPELRTLGLSRAQVSISLRICLNEELERAGLAVVGREEVLEAIAKRGPDFLARLKRTGKSPSDPLGWWTSAVSVLFGTLIPLTALGVEIGLRMSAEMFDPIPTFWHILAIAWVAFSNGWLTVLLGRERLAEPRVLTYALTGNAVAIGIAAYYALWFLPITPYAVVGIIAMGLGLLPLSPLISLITGLLLRRKLRKRAGVDRLVWPKIWIGAAAGFAALLALELPAVSTQWAALQVANGTPARQQSVLPWLRRLGSEEQLLRQCHWSRQRDEFRRTVVRAMFGELPMASAQQVYYRVTGQSHTRAERPRGWRNPRGFNEDRWVWDEALGGTEVGRMLPGLRLKESRLDGSLDGDGLAGYVEWTLVFRNDDAFQQREARALVQLPPGAVVSRLTLWINGEEREAAFGGRDEVRRAYQAVVQRRRDPVLVSSRGADRVLVQCFPVEPHGGEMKIRLGISLPLVPDTWNEAKAALPRIIEQNFEEIDNLRHAVWLEGPQPVTTTVAGARQERAASGRPALAFVLSTAQLKAGALNLAVPRDAALREMVAVGQGANAKTVRQELAQGAPGAELRIVLDGSRGMDGAARMLAAALRRLPERTPVRLFFAGDTVGECPFTAAGAVADWVERQEFVGGQDATEALLRAGEATAAGVTEVIWIHGQQPVRWQDASVLEQKLARAGGQTRFLAVAARSEANALVEKIHAAGALAVQPRLGQLEDDIARVIRWQREGKITVRRSEVPAGAIAPAVSRVTEHVVRLWALEEVNRLSHGRTPQREEAVRLAVAQQLVTPVSSAVVLETKAQYDAAGLTPVDPDSVPSVPDATQTVWLLGVALLGLLIFTRHSKCRARGKEMCLAPGAGGGRSAKASFFDPGWLSH